MLQWMGGSRRKVAASRKTTKNRQRQYFDQRKRKFQDVGIENNLDAREKHPFSNEVPRSLDVLSLMSLSSLTQHRSRSCSSNGLDVDASIKSDLASIHANDEIANDTHVPSEFLKQASNSSSNHIAMHDIIRNNGTGKNISSGVHLHSKLSNQGKEQRKKYLNDVSVIDLVSDGENCTERRSPAEAHVSFSIQGLGQVDMRTPLHTPERPKRKHFTTALPWNKEVENDPTDILLNTRSREFSPNLRNSYSSRVTKKELWNPTDLEHLGSKSRMDSVLHDEQSWKKDFNTMSRESSWAGLEIDDTTDSLGFLSEELFSPTADHHKKKSKCMMYKRRKRNSLGKFLRNSPYDDDDDDVKMMAEENSFINFDDISYPRNGMGSKQSHSRNALKTKSETLLPQFCNSQKLKESEFDSFSRKQCHFHDKELITFPFIGMPLDGAIVPTDYEILSKDHRSHVTYGHSSRPFTRYETVNHLDCDSPWDEFRHKHVQSCYVLDPATSYDLDMPCEYDPHKVRFQPMTKMDANISLNSHFEHIQSRVEGFSFPVRHVRRRLFTGDSYLQTIGSSRTSEQAEQKQPPVTDNISCSKSGEIVGVADSNHSCNGCELAKDNSKGSSNVCDGHDTHTTVENEVSRSSDEHVEAPDSGDEHHVEPAISINKGG